MKSTIRLISIIIPAYKQEKTIAKDVKRLKQVFRKLPYSLEIIVVVDGIVDKTSDKIKSMKNKKVRVLEYETNQGKGYAVRYGLSKARGDIVGFIDAGMDIHPSSIPILIKLMKKENADIVIGSKLHPQSRVKYPKTRRFLSWGYRTLTHVLFGFDIRDTQVGLKLFKKEVARDIFPRILVKKFAFDIEILAVAYSRNYKKIIEAPVNLNFSTASSITSNSFWGVVIRMLWDTAAVFYRLKILNYYDKILR